MGRILLFISLCCSQWLQAQENPDSLVWAVDLSNVVVTAQYAPTDQRQAIHPIKVLDQALISRRFSATLDKVLGYDAGIRIRQDMILGSAMSMQGQDGQRVKILLDGVPVIGRMNGNVDLNQLPLHNIERIEIVEGPLSVQYGTDALGGVINIITRSSQLKRWESSLRSSYESLGETRLDGSLGAWITPKWLVQAEGGVLDFKGFGYLDERDMLWNPKTQNHFGINTRFRPNDRHDIRYRYHQLDEEIENLGILRRPQFKPYAFDDYYYTARFEHSLNWKANWFEEQLYTELILADNAWDRVKKRQRTDLENGEFLLIAGEQDTNRIEALHFRATAATSLKKPINGMIGTELRREIARGSRVNDPKESARGYSRIDDYAFFGSMRHQPIQRLHGEFGLRWAYNTRFNTPIVPSLHLKANLSSNWTSRASWARGFRAPTSRELYFEFVDANHIIFGNADLRPETSDNFQLSLDWEQKTENRLLRFRLMGFYNDVRDQIGIYEFYEKDGERIPAQGDTITLNFAHFNLAHFRNHGLQGQVNYNWKGWQLQGSLLINGIHENESQRDQSIPDVTYVREYGWDISYQVPKYLTTFSFMGRHFDRLVTYYPEPENGVTVIRQRIQDGFSLMDLQVSQPFLKSRIRLHGGVRNLLDAQRTGVLDNGASLQHNSGSGEMPISPGRTWFIGLEWRG